MEEERLLEELDKFCLDLKLKLDSANSFNREYNMILDEFTSSTHKIWILLH